MKLVRRHPHVFGERHPFHRRRRAPAAGDQIKREQEGREGVFHDVPDALPALLHAPEGAAASAAVGFEYPISTARSPTSRTSSSS